jgi:hypothetical protein
MSSTTPLVTGLHSARNLVSVRNCRFPSTNQKVLWANRLAASWHLVCHKRSCAHQPFSDAIKHTVNGLHSARNFNSVTSCWFFLAPSSDTINRTAVDLGCAQFSGPRSFHFSFLPTFSLTPGYPFLPSFCSTRFFLLSVCMRSTRELWAGPNYTSRPHGPPSLRNPFLLGPAFMSSPSDLVRVY